LFSPEQRSQLSWHCEGDHEKGNRQQFALLLLKPFLAFMVLAVWAAAVSARMGNI
jgi:hypothetical protein